MPSMQQSQPSTAKKESEVNIKEKIVEALIDITKTCIYLAGGLTLLHFSDDNIVNYLDKIEKLKALREASLEYKSEELESSTRLLRAARRLAYSTYSLESFLSSGGVDTYEIGVFRENANDFLISLRSYLSYTSNLELREEGTRISRSVEDLLTDLSNASFTPKNRRELRINSMLLSSSLSKFILKMTQ